MANVNLNTQNTNLSQLLALKAVAQKNALSLANGLLGNNAPQTSGDAVSFNLSLAAQQIVNGNSGGSTTDSSTNFTLTKVQKDTIANILQKYKGQKLTQDTFKKILSDLSAAGLSADRLAFSDQVKNYHPKTALRNALAGNNSDVNALNNRISSEPVKKYNYLQNVIKQFQVINASSVVSTHG